MEPPNTPDDRASGRFYRAQTAEPPTFQFERRTPPYYRVMEQFDYVDKERHWYRVPLDVADNETDFASIPFFLTWLVPKDGSHTPAAVLHDALIGGAKGIDYDTSVPDTVPDEHADYLFREAMKVTGVPWLRRWIMWAAVALRTLTSYPAPPGSGDRGERKRWGRILLIGVVVGAWVIVSALMALDVPDLLRKRYTLPWLGDRPWWSEILNAVGMVAVGTAVLTVVFGLVLRARRGFSAGFFAGVAVGFLGLPMIASLVGAAGYFVLERLAARFVGD